MQTNKDTKCFVINVISNHNKRAHIKLQAKKYNVRFNFFKAYVPKDLPKLTHSYDPERTRIYYGRPLLETEMACAMSHIELWRQLLEEKKTDFYIILEDDVFLIVI